MHIAELWIKLHARVRHMPHDVIIPQPPALTHVSGLMPHADMPHAPLRAPSQMVSFNPMARVLGYFSATFKWLDSGDISMVSAAQVGP